MCSDQIFGYSGDAQAKLHQKDSPVYYYVYDYIVENSIFPEYMGMYCYLEVDFYCKFYPYILRSTVAALKLTLCRRHLKMEGPMV